MTMACTIFGNPSILYETSMPIAGVTTRNVHPAASGSLAKHSSVFSSAGPMGMPFLLDDPPILAAVQEEDFAFDGFCFCDSAALEQNRARESGCIVYTGR